MDSNNSNNRPRLARLRLLTSSRIELASSRPFSSAFPQKSPFGKLDSAGFLLAGRPGRALLQGACRRSVESTSTADFALACPLTPYDDVLDTCGCVCYWRAVLEPIKADARPLWCLELLQARCQDHPSSAARSRRLFGPLREENRLVHQRRKGTGLDRCRRSMVHQWLRISTNLTGCTGMPAGWTISASSSWLGRREIDRCQLERHDMTRYSVCISEVNRSFGLGT